MHLTFDPSSLFNSINSTSIVPIILALVGLWAIGCITVLLFIKGADK